MDRNPHGDGRQHPSPCHPSIPLGSFRQVQTDAPRRCMDLAPVSEVRSEL